MHSVIVTPLQWVEPCALFAHFVHHEGAVLLDSALAGDVRAQWSVIGLEPAAVLSGVVEQGFRYNGNPVTETLPDLMRMLAVEALASGDFPSGMPLPGVIGYLGFEAGVWCDAMPLPKTPRLLPDIWLGRYETLAVFHHPTQRNWLISIHAECSDVWKELQALCSTPVCQNYHERSPKGVWLDDTHANVYPAMVRQIVAHITNGDVFQINATWQFRGEKPEELDAFALYSALRKLSPAPYAVFLRLDADKALVSASPELFLQVDASGQVVTRPIKGTRPRENDIVRDAEVAEELGNATKDRAENLMIVDLMRNDLGRVCKMGSVHVPHLWDVEQFPNVHHLVSEVRGTLKQGQDAVDLLCACFPPGSVTGAPKVHCLKLIHDLEPVPRGAYCGSFIHLGGNGALTSNVLIRTMTVCKNTVTAQAGGGIVSDSQPDNELDEMLLKANAMLQALLVKF